MSIIETEGHFVIKPKPRTPRTPNGRSGISTIRTLPDTPSTVPEVTPLAFTTATQELSPGRGSSRVSSARISTISTLPDVSDGKKSLSSISTIRERGETKTNDNVLHIHTEADDEDSHSSDNDSSDIPVLDKTLMYFESTNPSLRRGRKKPAPFELFLPDKTIALGMHQQQKQDQEEEEIDTSTVMVYASRMRGQLGRSRCFLWFLLFLMPADACIVLTIMIQAAMNDTLTTVDGAIFVLTLLALVMAHVGTRTLDSRLMTIFETVYYIDALINLFRVENRLQFAHFGIQLVICHCVGGFKTSIAGQWFSPR